MKTIVIIIINILYGIYLFVYNYYKCSTKSNICYVSIFNNMNSKNKILIQKVNIIYYLFILTMVN